MSTPSLTTGGQEPFATQASFQSTLTAVCEAAVKLVGVDHSGLALFSKDYKSAKVMAEYPPRSPSVVDKEFSIEGVPLEEKLIRSHDPIVVQDVASEDSLGDVRKVLLDMGVRSIVVVPIIVGDEVKGSFSFDSIDKARDFTPDVEKCASLAKFASVAVENAYLMKNLDALRRAMIAISSEQKRMDLLKAITREAVNLIEAQGGGIDELDARKSELTIVAQFGMPEEFVGKTMKVGEGLAGKIINENLDFLTEPNYRDWPGKAPYFADDEILQSLVGVPLRVNEEQVGVLWLNAPTPRIFTSSEIRLLTGLAAPASIALEQTGLRDLERSKADRLQKLAQATNDVFVNLATSSRQQRLDRIAKHAHEIIDAELCGILLVARPGWLTLEAGHGYRPNRFEKGKALQILPGPGTGLTGYIAYTKEIFKGCGKELSDHPARAHKAGTGADYSPSGECYSLLGIPLLTEAGELKGLISINNKNDKEGEPNEWTCFTEEDQAIGGIFAQAALVAIETADLQDRYKTLLETSNVLALTKVTEDGLGALAKMVLRQIDKSFCRILFYHEADETIQVIAAEKATGEKGAFKWEQRLGEKTEVKHWLGLKQSLKSGEFVVQKRRDGSSDTNLDELSRLIELRDHEDRPLQINYLLRSPLKVNDRIIGLLIIGEIDRDGSFSEFEVDLARTIAMQASQLIERQEWNKRLLFDLFETERKISASTDEDSALRSVAEIVYDVGRAFGRKVSVVDINVRQGNKGRVVAAHPEGQLEHIRAIVGDPFDLTVGIGDDQRLGLVGSVFQSGKPINESDLRNNPHYVAIHEDTLSQLVVPILNQDDVVGAISVESSEASAFDKEDLMLLQGIAIQASSALSREKHSREYKKVRTVALAGAAAQLWRHGLRARAKLIIGRVDEARRQPSANTPDILQSIRDDALSIENFRFIPLSSTEGVADEILNEVLHNLLVQFREDMETKGLMFTLRLKLEQTKDRRVRINQRWFKKALSIFLENARAAITTATEKLIEVRTELSADSRSCRILIKNSGEKIREDIWDKMGHEQIIKGDGNTDKGGGLLLADLILPVYEGNLEKVNNQDNDIVLGITLPLID